MTLLHQELRKSQLILQDNLNKGVQRLRDGDFSATTWDLYDARTYKTWFCPRFEQSRRWAGEDLSDKTILLWYEQGIGDQILFASFLVPLVKKAKKVIFECEPRLVSLIQRSFPTVEVIPYQYPWDERVYDCDYQIPMGSVGKYLISSFYDFHFTRGYLKPDPERVEHFRNKYAGKNLVGISWSSSAQFYSDAKSVKLEAFEDILKGRNCISLQYGTKDDRVSCDDEVNLTQDIDDTAALMGACDKIITISNAAAHLAGATGRDTHVLVSNGFGRHWYWYPQASYNPFYPTLKAHLSPQKGKHLEIPEEIKRKVLTS
jgi:hypothetical protein